jgi:hypothetical protein
MIILDENIPAEQRERLEQWHLRVRQIGYDIGFSGMEDKQQVIPLLHSLRRSLFVTLDDGFYKRHLVHDAYCLLYLALEQNQVALHVRRFLRHTAFNTVAKRTGKVVKVSKGGIRVWQRGKNRPQIVAWSDSER